MEAILIKDLVFIDTEISESESIKDLGAIKENGDVFHSNNISGFSAFIGESYYIVGHNIIKHDSKYIKKALPLRYEFIDTLFLSPLLFPQKPYHNLVKDDKIIADQLNNPVNDSKKCKELFDSEIAAYKRLPQALKKIYSTLLMNTIEFRGFFDYVSVNKTRFLAYDIRKHFKNLICGNSKIEKFIANYPIELAYALAIISVNDKESLTPPWVQMNYPKVQEIIHLLRGVSCDRCAYCTGKFDANKRLKNIFNFSEFRKYGNEPLQENAVKAAIAGKSLLAVFPTGGGKSLAFQLPALIAGDTEKALTIVISPLQSLMKDQVDNLEERGIIDAVTINGMLNPLERKDAIDKLFDGKASILYIAPESLRSKTIERIVLSRSVARFVIDEAHCFSAWGQDFRVDYLYIADFIKRICDKKGIDKIPVSCFTATAKPKVISDICDYFKEKLDITLELFTTKASRKNLHYKVIPKNSKDEKYQALREIIKDKNSPTIVYVSTTRATEKIAARLNADGITALAYHGKMDKNIKAENQNSFKYDKVQVMVATSAFGMGVDKPNVGLVIHYEISDSLENYVQEAGRAGRDDHIEADCWVLFCEEDLDTHFMMLNQTKLNMNEIQQIWQAIKKITKNKNTISLSALELAREAGWDDQILDIETRVRTAVSALENVGYIERGTNSPRVFATGILVNSTAEARGVIEKSPLFEKEEIEDAVRIFSSIISSKKTNESVDDAESRIDYISDRLGIEKKRVIDLVNKFREVGILADSNDMIATISKNDSQNKSTIVLDKFIRLEKFILEKLEIGSNKLNIKEINHDAIKEGINNSTTKSIKIIFSYWTSLGYIGKNIDNNDNAYKVDLLYPKEELNKIIEKRSTVADYILSYLYDISSLDNKPVVEFSLLKLKNSYSGNSLLTLDDKATSKEIEDALLYLCKIHAVSLEGGILVIYNALQIKRLELNNAIKYKKEDYKSFEEFYNLKIQQIHIVGEYANMMVRDYSEALEFVHDYFNLEYDGFIKKYFKGNRRGEIQKNITPSKYNKLFASLSEKQKQIIDSPEQYIAVLAGPGSGKTKVLVHKLASLLLLEDIKSEQLLMLTFSRAAATEFKMRLLNLIGSAAHYVDIKTFHSYCFDLLGTLGEESEFDNVIPQAIAMIESDEVETSKIAKSVIVIDEAQDMSEIEYKLIRLLIEKNDDLRVIAVGDDDQNIYEFRQSSSKYLADFIKEYNAKRFEMLENYRSTKRVIDFTNSFVKTIPYRLKTNPINFVRKDLGAVEIVEHETKNLEYALVRQYIDNKSNGTVAFLTETNEDALKVLGILLEKNIQAKLIQADDKINVFNLIEFRYFINELGNCNIVLEDSWVKAKEKLNERYNGSTNLALINTIIKTYESINKEYYLSDFKEFLKESILGDFVDYNKNKIVVSTIHKSKGKEFDYVFVMIKNGEFFSNENKRKLYVAFTRAKNNLSIQISGKGLSKYSQYQNIDYKYDNNEYADPLNLCVQLNHKDVVLDFYKSRIKEAFNLLPGHELYYHKDKEGYLSNELGLPLVKFSQALCRKYNDIINLGYEFDKAYIRFIVEWFDKKDEKEYPIILPDIYFKKSENKE